MSKFDKILSRKTTGAGEGKPPVKRAAAPDRAKKKAKRVPGKSADRANFRQMTTYVPKKLHADVKVRLLQENPPKELSELVAELLETWLRSKK